MTLEEVVYTAYQAWSQRDIDTLLTVVDPDAVARPILGARDLHQEWETFETRVVRIEERGDRALLTLDIHACGRASGVVIEGETYHLVQIRDGLILRLEAFRDRDAAVRALEAA